MQNKNNKFCFYIESQIHSLTCSLTDSYIYKTFGPDMFNTDTNIYIYLFHIYYIVVFMPWSWPDKLATPVNFSLSLLLLLMFLVDVVVIIIIVVSLLFFFLSLYTEVVFELLYIMYIKIFYYIDFIIAVLSSIIMIMNI